jgi:hypothetical protein
MTGLFSALCSEHYMEARSSAQVLKCEVILTRLAGTVIANMTLSMGATPITSAISVGISITHP